MIGLFVVAAAVCAAATFVPLASGTAKNGELRVLAYRQLTPPTS